MFDEKPYKTGPTPLTRFPCPNCPEGHDDLEGLWACESKKTSPADLQIALTVEDIDAARDH